MAQATLTTEISFLGDLRLPELLSGYLSPTTDLRKSANHNTSKWEHIEASHAWMGKPVGNLTNDLPKLNTKYSKLLLIIYLAKL